MNIWVLNPYDPLPGEAGFFLRYGALCRELSRRGHNVVWWSAKWSHREKAQRSEVAEGCGFSVRLVEVREYRTNLGIGRVLSHRDFAQGVVRLGVRLVEERRLVRPDLVIASMPPVESCWAVTELKRRLLCSVVVDVMDAWPDVIAQTLAVRCSRRFGSLSFWRRFALFALLPYRLMLKRGLAVSDGVLAQSRSFVEFARSYGFRGATRFAYLGAARNPFAQLAEGSERKEGALRLAYIGSAGVLYELERICEVVERMGTLGVRVSLDIASGDRSVIGVLDEYRGVDGIRHHGLLELESMQRMLAGCDVGVVPMAPSSMVACPYKAGDYAMAGLAIVSSLTGELADLLLEYGAGCCYRFGDSDSLESALNAYIETPELLVSHREGAFGLGRARFDREVTYPAVAEWLESCIRSDRSA